MQKFLAFPKETQAGETRAAMVPEFVGKLIALGAMIEVEAGIGTHCGHSEADYIKVGATVCTDRVAMIQAADVIVQVRKPSLSDVSLMREGAVFVGLLDPFQSPELIQALAARGVSAISMEMVPRSTRAQKMDVLSSQANLAGYKAVVDAAATFGRAMPMMMTAAGTIAPARVLIMGVGVAGLQAIATAKRMGAIVSATDVRPATKEQVESLGGTFVAVMDEEFKNAQTAAGYAKPMSPEYQGKQAALTAETIKKQDIVITTALIPGRKAPILVTEEMIKTMKPGSVIVDLAAGAGGNTPLSKPDEVVEAHGVTILGPTNLPGALAVDASSLYARNLFNFLSLIVDKKTGALALDWNDEIVKGSAVTKDGAPVPRG